MAKKQMWRWLLPSVMVLALAAVTWLPAQSLASSHMKGEKAKGAKINKEES